MWRKPRGATLAQWGPMTEILHPGSNCWRVEPARRWAFLVDAECYFSAVAEAIETAKHSVVILGWDVHSRVLLRRGASDNADTNRLGVLLEAAAERGVQVRVLLWDFAVIYALEREPLPEVRLDWATHGNLRLALASDHPPGASHHQKIVVIDGALAFSGGIDLTVARWDRSGHEPDLDERKLPNGRPYGAFHDVQVAVDGWAAQALLDLAAARWQAATGRPLDVPVAEKQTDDLWPSGLTVDAQNVGVAIARTMAPHAETERIREVEQLWLDAIRAAQDTIYIENQYLTAARLADALVESLTQPRGPEICIATPRDLSGRLEELTMGRLRAQLVERLREADRHGRLTIVTPLDADGDPINVHAKVMVVDDAFVRVGSANASQRSMRLDSECDLAFEAADVPEHREAIRRFRNRLLAEHLGCAVSELEEALDDSSTLAGAIEALDDAGRLPELECQPPPSGGLTSGAGLGDLGEPLDHALPRTLMPDVPRAAARRRWPRVVGFIVVLLVLAGLWAWTPLQRWASPEALSDLISPLTSHPAGPVVFGVVAALMSLVGVPITALIVAASLLFGPWLGAVAGGLAALLSAVAGYALGRRALGDAVDRLGGERLGKVRRALERRGVLSVIAVRVLPVAPFTVVNAVAGSSRVSLRDYLIGTVVGMGPGLIGLSVAADSVAEVARHPDVETVLYAGVVLAGVVLVLVLIRRGLAAKESTSESSATTAT